ncbi:MAG: aldo/keto reductase [Christensenellales bacterium]|jgi:predicted aldo/keto reductase-like oxidoreductase
MKYRELGNTGISVSAVGLGAEHLDGKPYETVEQTIHAALENGINIMDVFMPGEEIRSNIGKALGKQRSRMFIQGHIGSVDLKQQYDISRDLSVCKRYFENLLSCLGTDYIDFGMLFFMDSDKALSLVHQNGILDYVHALKQQGVIRFIGASSHNPAIARKMVEEGMIDLLMFSINPAFDMTPTHQDVMEIFDGEHFSEQQYVQMDPAREQLYKLCAQKGVGITVMKTLGGGRLLSEHHSPFERPMSVAQCIHYALTRPGVASALMGCASAEQVQEAVGYFSLDERQKDYTGVIQSIQGSLTGRCVYCSHCQPCPADIDIANVNKYLDIASAAPEGIPPSIQQHYLSLNAYASACILCGSCEEKCPFDVPIMSNMDRAAKLFGK